MPIPGEGHEGIGNAQQENGSHRAPSASALPDGSILAQPGLGRQFQHAKIVALIAAEYWVVQ
jgi:hypothetical protein